MSESTSQQLRYLVRRNAEVGAGRVAEVFGYYVGGLPSTVNKVVNGRYVDDRVITSFASVFPMDKPEYLLLLSLDEPQPTEETKGFRTAAWNVGQMSRRIISQVAPHLGVQNRPHPTEDPFPIATKVTGIRASLLAE